MLKAQIERHGGSLEIDIPTHALNSATPAQGRAAVPGSKKVEIEELKGQIQALRLSVAYLEKFQQEPYPLNDRHFLERALEPSNYPLSEVPKFTNYIDLMSLLKPRDPQMYRRLCRAFLKEKSVLIRDTDMEIGVVTQPFRPNCGEITFTLHITNISHEALEDIRITPAEEEHLTAQEVKGLTESQQLLKNVNSNFLRRDRTNSQSLSHNPESAGCLHTISYAIEGANFLSLAPTEQEKIEVQVTNHEHPAIRDRAVLKMAFRYAS